MDEKTRKMQVCVSVGEGLIELKVVWDTKSLFVADHCLFVVDHCSLPMIVRCRSLFVADHCSLLFNVCC